MAGKPLIDILVLVDDLATAAKYSDAAVAAGYVAMGEYVRPGALFFYLGTPRKREINLHVFPQDHPHVQDMLSLRDYFRIHPETVAEYSQVKRELFEKYKDDYPSYRRNKDVYMQELNKRIGLQ